MIIHLNLTEDHIKLIPLLFIQDDSVREVSITEPENAPIHECCRIDKDHMYCLGSHLLEDISIALGLRDKAIANTAEAADGLAFPDDVEEYMLGIHKYLVDNLYHLETLIHQFVIKGGITAGEYVAKDNELIWKKKQ